MHSSNSTVDAATMLNSAADAATVALADSISSPATSTFTALPPSPRREGLAPSLAVAASRASSFPALRCDLTAEREESASVVFTMHQHTKIHKGRMARQMTIGDPGWVEVRLINSCAVFMGYLSMAVRGVGFLVLTWTTVVLLGGFVSVLEKEDFWCLTLITFVQIAGVFDVKKKEKLKCIWDSYDGFLRIVVMDGRKTDLPHPSRKLVAFVLALVQLLVFAAILFPLAAFYVCGLLITTGISLWRLIENDYGNAANLKPALNVLYSLALFQGVLFCYRFGVSRAGRRLADTVAERYGFEDRGRKLVKDYLRETRIECEKDPSFARGRRNLITYAVGLMKPESSSHDYVSGATILDKLLVQPVLVEHHKLIKQLLIGSASSSHVLHNLLQALDSRSPHDGEIRMLAARIVAHLAGDIRLEQFPRGIHSISFLLEASQQQDDDSVPSADYKELMEQGLRILEKLAADEDNCRAISNAQGLLSKVMAPVSSDILHRMDHVAWSRVVEASLQVMCRLVTARGETGTKLSHEISSNKEALSTMESILKCDQCNKKQLSIRAMEILRQLPMATESRESFIKKLLDVFADDKMGSDIRGLAGEKLAALSLKSKSDAVIVLQENGDVVGNLTKILLEDKSNKCRISAAGILEGLCIHYTDNVECINIMNKTLTDAMPKVLEATFCCGSAGQKIQTGTEAHEADISSPVTDIEEGQDGITSSPQNIEQPEELQEAFLSLSTTILDNLIIADQDFAHLFVGAPAFSFAGKLKEMVEGNSQPEPTVKCLRTMKLASKLAISMVTHGFVKVQDMQSFMQSLSKASEDMSELEGVMFISSGNHGATNSARTLASLVKEAQDLLGEKQLALSSMETSK